MSVRHLKRRRSTAGGCGRALRIPRRRRGSASGLALCVLLVGAATIPTTATAQPRPSGDIAAVTSILEPEIRRAMVDAMIPSLAVALVMDDDIVWSAAFGESNLRTRTPATPGTVYFIASTFKPLAAAAVLQLQEDELLGLDDPVRDYLDGLSIKGESDDLPITLRHLLTHTSGLPNLFSPVPVWADTVPPSLDRYLEQNLMVARPPLEEVSYSNLGYALVGHVVRRVSGTDFRDYLRDNLFQPLGMRSTAFAPTPEMEELMAMPYVPDEETGRLRPTSRLRVAEWPAGGVWGTVEDQARWLATVLGGGSYRGNRVLTEASVEAAQTVQFEELTGPAPAGWGYGTGGYGLGWWVGSYGGERYIVHAGSVRGYTALLHANVDRRHGVAILTNAHRAHEHLVRLAHLGTQLLGEHAP